MTFKSGNLFIDAVSPPAQEERHDELHSTPAVRVTRIASNAHSSPEDFWYDQPGDEWVAVLAGDAVIELDDGHWHSMGAGDWVVIPAHCRHRIAGTDEKTIWLAVDCSGHALGDDRNR